MTFTQDGNEFTNQTLTGCSSISSAQVMNYYGYCKPLTLSGENQTKNYTNLVSVSSPYFTSSDGNKFSYSFSYTPDFDKIAYDNNEMSKFIVGIAFAQKAIFGPDATSTYATDQVSAFNDFFGYRAERKSISSLSDGDYIADAIKRAQPIIIDGENDNDGGHSFIIDGYNGNEFHIDYGWSGNSNGWFTATDYPNNMGIIIVRPDIENMTYMQQTPKYVVVDGKKVAMSQYGEDILQYKQNEVVSLSAGEHSFYFEYADGSKLSPYATKEIVLSNSNRSYTKYGNYVTEVAKFKISADYNLNFYHNLGQGEVKLELADADITISGKVLDKNNQPVKGATVTTATANPVPEIDCQNDGSFHSGYSVQNTTISFIPTKNFLTGFVLNFWLEGSPTSDLKVALLDNNMKELQSQSFPKTNFSKYSKDLEINFDEPISITAGQKYYISLSADKDDNNYYVCAAFGKNDYFYKVFGVDDYYTETDENGNYEFSVSKHWSGVLHAYYGNKTFNSLNFEKIQFSATDKNFNENADDETIAATYSITYIVDNQTYKLIEGIAKDSEIPSVSVPTKTGYVFKGWTPELPTKMPENNLVVTAEWTKIVTPTVTLSSTLFEYTGEEINPKVTLKDGETIISETEYTVTYSDNQNLGTSAKITIKDNDGGNYMFDEIIKNFTITRKSVTVTAENKTKVYGEDDPVFTATVSTLIGDDVINYTISRKKGENTGTYDIVPSGENIQGNYSVTFRSATLTITAKEISPTVELSAISFEYTGSEIKPQVTIRNGRVVMSLSEYTVTYSDNINVGTSAKVIITDNDGGNYTFEKIEKTFEIKAKPITPIIEESEESETPSENTETPVSELVPSDNVKVWSFDKTIFINANVGQSYKIIDINGRILKTSVTESDREEVILSRNINGIVIVKIGKKSFKLKL